MSRLHTWGIVTPDAACPDPAGVCREASEAFRAVSEQLRTASADAVGLVCAVPTNTPITLDDPAARTIAIAHLDHATGTVVWRRGDP